MLEYRIELADRTTYFVDDNPSPTKSYDLQFIFMTEKSRLGKITFLKQKVEQLKKLSSINITITWRILEDAILLDDEQFEAICPLGEDGETRIVICD